MRRASSSLSFAGFLLFLLLASMSVVCGGDAYSTTEEYIFGNFTTDNEACGNNSQNCNLLCGFCDSVLYGSPRLSRMACYQLLIEDSCYKTFQKDLPVGNHTRWCMWNNLKSHYNNFTMCTEMIADCLRIPWPNKYVEDVFVQIHAKYFKDCPVTELSDPPPSIVFALVMTPICLIPIMVVLVVLKTKNGDGTS
ncbi:receptor activity-modifying protein 1-like isoform X1 [Arapaima gigas]